MGVVSQPFCLYLSISHLPSISHTHTFRDDFFRKGYIKQNSNKVTLRLYLHGHYINCMFVLDRIILWYAFSIAAFFFQLFPLLFNLQFQEKFYISNLVNINVHWVVSLSNKNTTFIFLISSNGQRVKLKKLCKREIPCDLSAP